jgi:hypothetical protein
MLHQALPNEKWYFDFLDLSGEAELVVQAIKQGSAIALSDGSFKDEYGTAAYVIEAAGTKNRIV